MSATERTGIALILKGKAMKATMLFLAFLGAGVHFGASVLLLWGRDYLCLTKISIDMNMLDAHLATCCHAAKRSGHRTAQMVSRVVLGEGVVQPGRANPPGRLIWTIIWQA